MRRTELAAALAFALCGAAAAAAQAQPETQRFSACEYIADARALDALRRPGIGARVCAIAPGLRFAIMADDTVSWPQIKHGARAWVSLEDPIARKLWFAETAPLRVRFSEDSYVVVRDAAGAPRAVVYSAAASRTLGGGSIVALVAVRIAAPCVLAVTADRPAALRAAGDGNAPCLAAFSRGR